MPPSIFYQAADWVADRIQPTSSQAQRDDIASAIEHLHGYASRCTTALMLPGLFPEVSLETLFVPKSNTTGKKISEAQNHVSEAGITTASLKAIGTAIAAQMAKGGHDMLCYDFDDGARAIAYLPEVRGTVLMATGVVLLDA